MHLKLGTILFHSGKCLLRGGCRKQRQKLHREKANQINLLKANRQTQTSQGLLICFSEMKKVAAIPMSSLCLTQNLPQTSLIFIFPSQMNPEVGPEGTPQIDKAEGAENHVPTWRTLL